MRLVRIRARPESHPYAESEAARRRIDPDDMLAVVALECGLCGASGTMVLGYGPASSDSDGDVLRALQDRRDDGDLPAHAPPSETPE